MEYRMTTLLMGMHKRATTEPYADDPVRTVVLANVIAEVAFYVVIGTLAAYLSWSTNAMIGWHPGVCFVFSLVAFFFAGIYLISHVLFKLDMIAAFGVLKAMILTQS